MKSSQEIIAIIRLARIVIVIFAVFIVLLPFGFILYRNPDILQKKAEVSPEPEVKVMQLWMAPDPAAIPDSEEGIAIRYGKELVTHTSSFIGPSGSLSKNANGMNCQNCHLEAGTKPYGNNFGSVASQYPKFRARSGSYETIEKRVNDCFQRSLNGAPLDSFSAEMKSIVAYIRWVGKDVPEGEKAKGSGLPEMKWLDRAADVHKGKISYMQNCRACHGNSGEGQKNLNDGNYIYPPLSGAHSFNTAAGLYRISNFAKYIYANMPHGATYNNPVLTEQESWDIAAYVLSMPRTKKEFSNDWPKLATKPVDHPFGPYADGFSEEQHKYGPFAPIEKFYQAQKTN